MSITAAMVKALRDETGAGMMDCKKALSETSGDKEAAKDLLRKKGLATAEKRQGRATEQGLVRFHLNGNVAGMVEVNCETDFVSRNEEFDALASRLAEEVAKGHFASVDELMAHPLDGRPAQDHLTDLIGKIGENMAVSNCVRIALAGPGLIEPYLHGGGRVGVLVALGAPSDEVAAKPEFREVAHDIALHIAFANPVGIDRTTVPAETVERERRISRERALEQGKPEQVVDKIVEGQLSKFYAQIVLLEQPFVKEEKSSVKEWLAEHGKRLGGLPEIKAFARFDVTEAKD